VPTIFPFPQNCLARLFSLYVGNILLFAESRRITSFQVWNSNVVITAILAATALGWIIFGFTKRYQYIRLSGLGLSFLAVIKLFVVDLNFLSAGMRIVSYFMMGIALLAISFIYQHFNKKLEAPKGDEPA
jgi:uncharacterized membrane protein